VMSIFVQYASSDLEGGWNEEKKAQFLDVVVDTLAEHAPNLKKILIHKHIMTPWDLERTIGLTGGHIFQGECLPAYMWSNRFAARTPMEGVYLCGACTHPGGSVIGINGRNAAMAVLRDLDSSR